MSDSLRLIPLLGWLATTAMLTGPGGAPCAANLRHTTDALSRSTPDVAGAAAGTTIAFAAVGWVDLYDIATDTWSVHDLGQHREHVSAASVGNLILVAGGYLGGGVHSDQVDIYNVDTKQWRTATLSTGRSRMATATVGTKVFFAGGWDGWGSNSRVVDVYDAATDRWSGLMLRTTSGGSAAAALGSRVFITDSDYVGDIDIYDVETETWDTASLSTTRTHPACVAIGDKVLFAGGYKWPGGPRAGSDVVDMYDATTDTWSTASLTVGRWNMAATVLGPFALFGGGAVDRGQAPTLCSRRLDVYDSRTGQWAVGPPLDVARCGLGAASAGGYALFAGGDREYGSSSYDVVDVYSPLVQGDVDGDFRVNIYDAFLLDAAWGTVPGDPAFNPDADLNNDGAVNSQDAFLLNRDWGQDWQSPSGASPPTSAVPEPSLASLVSCGAAALLLRRKRSPSGARAVGAR